MIAEKVQELEQENTRLREQMQKLRDICGGVELPKNYIRTGSTYHPIHNGHCKAGNRVKDRKVSDTCKAYAKKVYGKNCI